MDEYRIISVTQLTNPANFVRDAKYITPFATQTLASELMIQFGARVCYRSVARMDSGEVLIKGCIQSEHYDVLEHGYVVFEVPDIGYWEHFKYLNCVITDRCLVGGNLRAWYDALYHIPSDVSATVYTLLHKVSPTVFPHFGKISHPLPVSPIKTISAGEYSQLLATSGIIFDDTRDALLLNYATFYFDGISRSMTHQLVRHRLGSFCLDGDTVVPAFRPKIKNYGKKWTMQQLYQWSQDNSRKGRLRLIKLRGVNQSGEIIPVTIKSVIDCGVQSVYQVTTESGRCIKATMNHRFFTPTGWKPLSEISVGDKVWANGIEAYKNKEYLKQRYLVDNVERKVLARDLGISDATLGKWIAKFGLQKPKTQYPNRKPGHSYKGIFSEEEKKEISKRMSGEKNHRWKGDKIKPQSGRLRANKLFSATICERCNSTYRVQRHHKDNNPLNNDKDNISILCEPCHKAEHFGQVVMTVFPDKIISIEFAGNTNTYDLEIDHECHNFVANGFVVHNSQASQRYIDPHKGEWGYVTPPSYYEDPEVLERFEEHQKTVAEFYDWLRGKKIRKEDARFILNNSCETAIVVSGNFEMWKHFLKLRQAKDAQWEIRRVADEVAQQLCEVAPHVFDSL